MSWNISTRLNNLQQQINNIANKGLTNPLEQILDANSYSMINLNILDGGNNSIEMKTNNASGILMSSNLNVDADISCDVLNYKTLNPPINTNGISYSILGQSVIENTPSNFSFSFYNPYNGIISNTNILNPTASMNLSYNVASTENSVSVGFSNVNNLYPQSNELGCQFGIYWYPSTNLITQITNGSLTSNTYSYTNQTNLDVILKIIDGTLHIYINNVEIPILNQSLNGLLYFCVGSFTNETLTLSNLVVNQTFAETLEQVLTNGNSAGNLDITDVNNLTCNTLNYTTLNPPITGGGENLQQTLTNGNSAGNLDIIDVNKFSVIDIEASGNIYVDKYLEVGNAINGSSQIHLLYGDGTDTGNNYQIVGASDSFLLQQYKNNALYSQPFSIYDNSQIRLTTGQMTYSNDNGTTISNILDSLTYTPIYKQYFTGIQGGYASTELSPSNLLMFSITTFPSSLNTSTNYGIKNSDITFTNLNLTFNTLSTESPVPNFSTSQTARIYLSSTEFTFTPTESNSIVIPLVSSTGTATNQVNFNSTIPIILWNSSTSNNNKLYLCVLIAGIPPIGVSSYQVNMTSSDFIVNSYVSNTQNGTITFGQ